MLNDVTSDWFGGSPLDRFWKWGHPQINWLNVGESQAHLIWKALRFNNGTMQSYYAKNWFRSCWHVIKLVREVSLTTNHAFACQVSVRRVNLVLRTTFDSTTAFQFKRWQSWVFAAVNHNHNFKTVVISPL